MPFIGLFIFGFFAIASASAEELGHSSVGMAFDAGTFDYRDLVLDGKIAFGPQYRVLLGGQHSKSESAGVSSRLRAGGDVKISQVVLVRAGLSLGNEPNDIKSAGMNVGSDGILSELWEGKRDTRLSIDYSLVSYRQRLSPNDTTKRLASRFRQQEWTFAIDQEVTDALSVDGYISLYSYLGATGNDVNLAVDRRRARMANWESTVQGFAQTSYGFGLYYDINKSWTPGLSYSHSRVVFANAQSDTFGSSLTYNYSPNWVFSVRGSRTKQEYDSRPSLIGGFSVNYKF